MGRTDAVTRRKLDERTSGAWPCPYHFQATHTYTHTHSLSLRPLPTQ